MEVKINSFDDVIFKIQVNPDNLTETILEEIIQTIGQKIGRNLTLDDLFKSNVRCYSDLSDCLCTLIFNRRQLEAKKYIKITR
jgi:hypothetical protein